MHFGTGGKSRVLAVRLDTHVTTSATRTTRSTQQRTLHKRKCGAHSLAAVQCKRFVIHDSFIVLAHTLCRNHYSSVIATLSFRFRVKVIYIKSEV